MVVRAMVQKSPDRDALCRKLTTGQATDLLATCQEHRARYRGGSQQVGIDKIRIVPGELDIH